MHARAQAHTCDTSAMEFSKMNASKFVTLKILCIFHRIIFLCARLKVPQMRQHYCRYILSVSHYPALFWGLRCLSFEYMSDKKINKLSICFHFSLAVNRQQGTDPPVSRNEEKSQIPLFLKIHLCRL